MLSGMRSSNGIGRGGGDRVGGGGAFLSFLLLVLVTIQLPQSTNAIFKRKKRGPGVNSVSHVGGRIPPGGPGGPPGGMNTASNRYINEDGVPIEKKFKRPKKPKLIRGRLGLPSRRKKKQGLSAVLFPGVSPEDFMEGEEIPIWVDLVESRKTHLPYEYYDLPICAGPSVARASRMRKNLGARLQGHNLKPSPYEITTLKDVGCTVMCVVSLDNPRIHWLRQLIDRQYRIHMTFDSLPVIMRKKDMNYVLRGYPVGFKAPPDFADSKEVEFYLYNHVRFVISYRDSTSFDGVRIVGFEAQPVSIDHQVSSDKGVMDPNAQFETCGRAGGLDDEEDPLAVPVENNLETLLNLRVPSDRRNRRSGIPALDVVYSYEVQWIESDLDWSDRWDIYMAGATASDNFHFFSLVNSLVILLFLTGTVAVIVLRTLRKDISRYNELDTMDEDESGWKLMHGDVFRPPAKYASLLCVAVGTGVQLGTVVLSTLFLALFGFLSPMKKGQMLTTIIFLYVFAGSIGGFISSRLYKFFEATKWKRNMMLTATAFPGLLFTMFLVLDLFLSFAGAATAVSLWLVIAMFLLWLCVSTPLVFIGSFVGFKLNKLDVPTKTNQIARVVPQTKWFVNVPYCVFLAGLVPFGSVCVEFYFIMSALWLHQIYYVMGFLLAVVLILAASCAEMSIIMCYIQLCAEDHEWWWRAFWNSAGAGLWLFLYSVWFLSTNLKLVGILPTLVYLTYMSMVAIAFALFCGSVGFLSTFWFTKKIYGALKVD